MNTVTSMQDLLDRKNGSPCPLCSVIHRPQVQCAREHLAAKITKLLEANAMIPGLLQHNKEATESAVGFQTIIKKFDGALMLLMDILAGHGEVGEQIKNEYMEKLDLWIKNEPVVGGHESGEEVQGSFNFGGKKSPTLI